LTSRTGAVVRRSTELAFSARLAKEVITTEFVEALREAVSEYDANCAPEDSIRLRLALHAGEALEGEGEWAGRPVNTVCRLVDSSVLKRVLAASMGSPLAVIVSSGWYDAMVREGYVPADGYRKVWVEVKTFADIAWVKVPGRSSPPGLLPEDDPARHRADGNSATSSSSGRHDADESRSHGGITVHGNAITGGTFQRDVVFGDKYSFGSERQNQADGR
jgi:hypothetical protein